MTRSIVFYDTEFTTWEGALDNNWSKEGQETELVQIAAIRFDLDTLEELEEFEVFVKPVINPQLSDLFTELTGITQQEVDVKGVPFPDALAQFQSFADKAITASYGWDHKVMRRNQELTNLPQDFIGVDIAPWFQKYGAPHGVTPTTNSGKLAAAVGAEMNAIQEHNALHDVRSICAAYRFLIGKGVVAPF